MNGKQGMRLLYFDEDMQFPEDLLAQIGEIDSQTPLCRSWETLLSEIRENSLQKYDVVLHVTGSDWKRALSRVDHIWRLRIRSNYSIRPRHLVVSAGEVSAKVTRKFTNAGAHFVHLDEIRALRKRLRRELGLIRLEIAEVECNIPRFLSIHEGNPHGERCIPGEIPNLRFLFGKAETQVHGPLPVIALITVMLMENGRHRTRKELLQLLHQSVFYDPNGGIVPIPSLNTLKTYLDQDITEVLQKSFDELRSGFLTKTLLEHKRLGNKAIGYRLCGHVISVKHRK
jgi:hypothetical protein